MIVGAVTVLVVIVAVFLAYNANNGLPFVSTYNLKARVPNANALVKGNEVRIGGARVGVVKSVVPVQTGNGEVAAELNLSLDKNVEPLPDNSTMIIRPKSPLGLKYLQIVPGDSSKGFAAGDTIPVSAARPEPVDIDQFFDMFDEKTRNAIQRNLAGFGNALAGRGPQLNNAFVALRMLVESSQPTLANLVAPSTGFGEFWRALEALSATVAPVAEQQASMFVALDRTFAAFARVSRPYIQETISKGPETLDTATDDLPALRPFLHDSERFFTALEPGRQGARRNLADDRRRAARRHPGAQPLADPQRPAAADRRRAARLPAVARRLQRPRPADRHQRTARRRRSGSSPRPRPPATTSASPSATSPAPPAKTTASAAGSTRSPSSRRTGPTPRAAQPRRPPTAAPQIAQPPPLQPLPEHRFARAAERVRGGQRALRKRA